MAEDVYGDNDQCPGCGHSMARHYLNPRGNAYCLVVQNIAGVALGPDGKPYGRACSCKNGVPVRSSLLTPDPR